MVVYVLELTQNKYYVGRTNDLERRLVEHQNDFGSKWTKKYQFVSLLETHDDHGNLFYENMITLTMMSKHGIENVRGGIYAQLKLSKSDIAHIEKEFRNAADDCFKCGGNHFAHKCKSKRSKPIKQKTAIIDDCEYSDHSDRYQTLKIV